LLNLPPIIWIIVQAAAALGGVALWLTVIAPAVAQLRERRLVLSVWGPIVLILPMLFLVAGAEGSVRGVARLAISGPVLIGMVATVLALLSGSMPSSEADDRARAFRGFGWFAMTVWIGTGVVLLLLTAANELNVMVGQCVFAAAAVVLWMNTPSMADMQQARGSASSAGEGRAAGGLFLAMALAIAQGVALLLAGLDAVPVTAGIAFGSALIVIIGLAMRGSAIDALSLGGWSATFGVLLAIGALSLLHMLPTVTETFAGDSNPALTVAARPLAQVARGFAALAPEATAMIAAGLVGAFAVRLPARARRPIALALMVLAGCLLLAGVLSG